MAAYKISTKRQALLLGIAVLLIASCSQAQSRFARDDTSAEQSNTAVSDARVGINVDSPSSSQVETDRQPLIKIPVINGVATPVGVESGNVKSTASGVEGGEVRFEMDHKVPSTEDLENLYSNEGRNLLFSSRSAKSVGNDKQPQSENSAYRKGLDVPKSSLEPSNLSTDNKEERIKGKDHTAEGGGLTVESNEVSVNKNEQSTSKEQQEERKEADHKRGKEELVGRMIEKLLDPYRTTAIAELDIYKKEEHSKIGSGSKETKGEEKMKEGQTKVVEKQNGEVVVVNKLNKNYDNFDQLTRDDVQNGDESTVKFETGAGAGAGTGTGSRGDRTRNRVLEHHHHHHVTHPQAPFQQQPQQSRQQQMILQENSNIQDPSLKDVADDERPYTLSMAPQDGTGIKDNGDRQVLVSSEADNENEDEIGTEDEIGIGEDENDTPASSPVPATSPAPVAPSVPTTPPVPVTPPVPALPVMPDALRTRGMIPSVQGAHHCTPQFCVNVSLSDDGYFATFHIERAAAETGWISLGIGYAMTMADLIVLWPNPTAQNGGGPRGAVLSRRTSHAYVEPTLVGHSSGNNPLGDTAAEASLYPPNEYVLHNSNPGGANTTIFSDASRFIVQFTRPIRTRNTDYKLTPGEEQDFCWAYSPQPISPDSVADPGAHIAQHLSVGSFAMDVGASQPQLKDVLLKQKELNDRLDAAEKERKRKELDRNNRQLQNEERKKAKANGKHKTKNQHAASTVSSDSVAHSGPIGAYPSLAQISCCLVAIALAVSVY